jgi:geranylgeranyl reductase family protein
MKNPDIIKNNFDVIVVGAGPAGCSCAFHLANKGIKVLLLEKHNLPREKQCAGGVPGSIFSEYSIEPDSIGAIPIRKYIFTFQGEDKTEGDLEKGLIYSVKRNLFDEQLAKKATQAGTVLFEDFTINNIEINLNQVFITSQEGDEFSSQFLVICDGGHSATAKKCSMTGEDYRENIGSCCYYELKPSNKVLNKYQQTVHLDLNFVKGAFAGVIAKDDHLWVGVYSRKKCQLKDLGKYIKDFMEYFKLEGTTERLKGLHIPLYNQDRVVRVGNILTAGEAAGLVNPLSGEGIKPALDSGRIAAEEISNAIIQKKDLSGYQNRICEEIGRELLIGERFHKLAFVFPAIAYEGMVRSVDDALKILNGNLSYENFQKRLLDKIKRRLLPKWR